MWSRLPNKLAFASVNRALESFSGSISHETLHVSIAAEGEPLTESRTFNCCSSLSGSIMDKSTPGLFRRMN